MSGLDHARVLSTGLGAVLLAMSSHGGAQADPARSASAACLAPAPRLPATVLAELKERQVRVCAIPGAAQGNPDQSDIVVWDPGNASWALSAAMPATGAVQVLARQGETWTLTRVLRSPRPLAYGGFGTQLALAGTTLAVVQAKPVTVWTFDLQAPAQPAIDIPDARGFARSVAGSDGMVIVGGIGEARVYVKAASGWRVQERIAAPAAAPNLFTGQIVATPELLVATVGGLNQGDGPVVHGRIDVFRRTAGAWRREATLHPGGAGAPFGLNCCVAISGSDVVVTANGAPVRFRHTASGWQVDNGSAR